MRIVHAPTAQSTAQEPQGQTVQSEDPAQEESEDPAQEPAERRQARHEESKDPA